MGGQCRTVHAAQERMTLGACVEYLPLNATYLAYPQRRWQLHFGQEQDRGEPVQEAECSLDEWASAGAQESSLRLEDYFAISCSVLNVIV